MFSPEHFHLIISNTAQRSLIRVAGVITVSAEFLMLGLDFGEAPNVKTVLGDGRFLCRGVILSVAAGGF